ncbi:hypothetical protein [Litchfieldia salsa]|uniref:Uncharacterized protein n=1 Tax=Litchfieldia salsa TaxID=930152 RepID=A0A1H0P3U6_9BACI|nr:hypothetical protein [Litchfieldia salsa]SDO99747.1 hypothetical protein SAMN05216565_101148 [Litchfieldia salsa]
MKDYFKFDERLGIRIPVFSKPWDEYSDSEQQEILMLWEGIRGRIPDRIAELEDIINEKQVQLGNELDFPRSCQLNSEISEHASIINDLWLWYRTNQKVSQKGHF